MSAVHWTEWRQIGGAWERTGQTLTNGQHVPPGFETNEEATCVNVPDAGTLTRVWRPSSWPITRGWSTEVMN